MNPPRLNVLTPQGQSGTLFKDDDTYLFGYTSSDPACAISLTMPIRAAQYSRTALHPVFQMKLRVAKTRTGEHGCRTPAEALAVIGSMEGKWSDEHIAATLNRMGLPTGQAKTWTAHRVSSVRRVAFMACCPARAAMETPGC